MNDNLTPATLNEDRELWRERDDYYANSVHVTKQGGLGIKVGGLTYVKTLAEWYKLATPQYRACPHCGKEQFWHQPHNEWKHSTGSHAFDCTPARMDEDEKYSCNTRNDVSNGFICGAWRIREQGPILDFSTMRRQRYVNRCDRPEGHKGQHVDKVLLVNWIGEHEPGLAATPVAPIEGPMPSSAANAFSVCSHCGVKIYRNEDEDVWRHYGFGNQHCGRADPATSKATPSEITELPINLQEKHMSRRAKSLAEIASMKAVPSAEPVAPITDRQLCMLSQCFNRDNRIGGDDYFTINKWLESQIAALRGAK